MALNIFKQPERFSDTSDVQSPATPADRARAVMDKRIGSVVVQSYNWRRISLGLLVVCIVLSVGLTVQSLKSRVVPYVVTVDKSTGEVEKAGAFVSQDYTPQEAEVRYFLAQFIQNARSIQLDPVQQEKMQKKEKHPEETHKRGTASPERVDPSWRACHSGSRRGASRATPGSPDEAPSTR